jgi:hypothetical protein
MLALRYVAKPSQPRYGTNAPTARRSIRAAVAAY